MKKILSAMSGGVDSSVAAQILLGGKDAAVTGVTLALFNDQLKTKCSSEQDILDAKTVAKRLGIEHLVWDYAQFFVHEVVDEFVDIYLSGKTPNPCIICNKKIKFGHLIDEAVKLGYDHIATGHYVEIEKDNATGRFLLKRAKDESKDQSYVLYTLTQAQLSHSLFPLGGLTKAEVRQIANENGFINADKADSQDICFIKDGNYKDFINNYTDRRAAQGKFIDVHGNILGTHSGLCNYTVGQRRGIELEMNKPIYIVQKDIANNTITVGDKNDLLASKLTTTDINLIPFDRLDAPLQVTAKTRYKQAETAAVIEQIDKNTIFVDFASPVSAITPGQAVVFYDGDYVVGGGTIIV